MKIFRFAVLVTGLKGWLAALLDPLTPHGASKGGHKAYHTE